MIKLLLLLSSILLAHAVDYKSNIALKYKSYDSFTNELLFQGDTKLKLENDIFTSNINIEYLYSKEYKQKRYLMLNELYITKEYEYYSFVFGKTIKFLGELEGFNIADIYNQKNYLLDPFDKSAKLGSYSLFATKYFNEESVEFGIKFYEESQKYPTKETPYAPLGINYDNELELSDQTYTPTVYLTYSLPNAKIVFMHGYDNKRYFMPINENTLSQYAYRVNKLLLTSNWLYKDAIFKLESSCTDVIEDKYMGDYTQISFGVENNFYDVYGADIGVYTEYYKYIYLEESVKNVDISEIYDNDIFMALKLNFNDVGASEIKGGLMHDVKNREEVLKIEVKTRVMDVCVVQGEFLQTLPKENTLLSNIGESTRFTFGLTYSF
ncbi:hypothetical protein KJ870_09675 [bacterium]|nr:hypothetical protein [bacterium]MBU1435195.1 hypothetical protein [bacterium]MBU1502852.1 hypothetical protein [bacterium]